MITKNKSIKPQKEIIKDIRIRLTNATRQKNKAKRDQWTAESHMEYYQKKIEILEEIEKQG